MPIRNAKTPEKRSQLLETLLGAGTWTYDLVSRELIWSEGLYRLAGLDHKAVVANFELYESLLHPDDRLAHEEIEELAHANQLSVRRFRMIRPDGHLIWVESRFDRQYDRNGRLAILHGVVQDVTDDQKAQAAHGRTAAANASLRKILGGEFWRADADGKLLDFTNWMRYTGQTAEQLRDYDALAAVHPDDRQRFLNTWQAAIEGKRRLDLSVRVRRYDGVYQRFDNSAVPLLDSDGNIVEWHGVSKVVEDVVRDLNQQNAINEVHIRAARAMLEWTAAELAERTGVSFSTIRRMEVDAQSVKAENVQRVRETFEGNGIIFLSGPADAVFVSLVGAS
jgi:PAS domain S-box-containing protein